MIEMHNEDSDIVIVDVVKETGRVWMLFSENQGHRASMVFSVEEAAALGRTLINAAATAAGYGKEAVL